MEKSKDMSAQSSNDISQINQEEIKWKIQRIESFLSSASEEVDSAKEMLLNRFKRYPEGFREARLRLLGIVTFSIPLILVFRDFPELEGIRPYLLLLVAGVIGIGILVYFMYEFRKKTVNNLLDKLEIGYEIVNYRINIQRGLVMSLTKTIQEIKPPTVDFLFDLATIVIVLRMELLDALRNSSGSKLFSDADKDFLTGMANGLDEIMRETFKVGYKPREKQFNEFIKVSKPGISEVFTGLFDALKKFHDRYNVVGSGEDEESEESKKNNIKNSDTNR
jgi:hypothetical protein